MPYMIKVKPMFFLIAFKLDLLSDEDEIKEYIKNFLNKNEGFTLHTTL